MSDREDKKLNLGDELADVKSLIAGAEDGGFSLDDILAEYGVKSPPGRSAIPLRPSPPEGDGPDLPWPEPPRPRRNRDNVVAFPGGGALPPEEDGPAPQDESEPEKGPSEPEGEAPEADAVLDAEENGDKVVEFPEEESPLASFLKDISKKADDYADRMFEESEQMDPEEVRRLETLIPGTDQETEEDLRYVRQAPPVGGRIPVAAAGQLLYQPQLLDVPGNRGLGGGIAPGPQLIQQLLLGLHIHALNDVQDLRLTRTLHGTYPPNF